MNLTQTTIDRPTLTCSICPFARYLDGNRYVCGVSETAADVVRGHWEAKANCHEAIAQAEAEKAAQAPIAKTEIPAPAIIPAPAKPATVPAIIPAPIAPVATGENDEPPNRGDTGRGRLQPMPTKKLMLSIVPVKRITSDIPACNFDPGELEIAGELSLAIGGFVIPPVLVRDSSGYKVVSGHFQYHAAVLARRLNPKAGENIPAIVLEPDTESPLLAQLEILKLRRF